MNLRNFTLIIFLFISLTATAQEDQEPLEELVTDRPDETEAPSVVPKGTLQIESGIAFEQGEYAAITREEWTWNTTLLRYGVSESLELRLGTDVVKLREEYYGHIGFQEGTISMEWETGFKPLLFGAKVELAQENGLLPQTGLLVHVLLPFAASEQYRPDEVGFDFRFAFSHSITENSEIAYNLGAEWHDDASSPTYIYTFAYDFELSDRWGVFAEVYGDLEKDRTGEHFWDGGLTYLVAPNFQLDVFIGTGIKNEQELRAGAGFSYRIPN